MLYTFDIILSLGSACSQAPLILWEKSFGGTSSDAQISIKALTDNGFSLAGAALSNDGDISNNHGNSDFGF
ncbi:MAG: hypothetical protein IPP99_00065 [Chitinophagaceae bacterium]|nr:hypothetical protein [Chitinophagaceae bacterium]